MKTTLGLLLAAGTLLALLTQWTLTAAQEASRDKPPPLSLEGLLDERLPEPPRRPLRMKVDNSACYVCHVNYQEELLVVEHGKEEISCIDCHGPSAAHRNDEDNITPPDVMFPLAGIDGMCRECHETHDTEAWKIIDRWQRRCPDKTDVSQLVCTDCHYEHRLDRRAVVWNKQTGQLISREAPAKPPAETPAVGAVGAE